jgi:AcrR family transcriptional regulator
MKKKKVIQRRRRSSLKGDAQRAYVLQIARDVFCKHGYRDANLSEICEIAGIGRGTLYRHFETKRAILIAMIEEIGARVEKALADQPTPTAPEPGKSLREALLEFSVRRMETVMRAVFADEATLRILVVGARGVDDAVDALTKKIDDLVLGSLEADLRIGQMAGALRDVDVRSIARFCLGGLQKLLLLQFQDGEAIDIPKVTRLVVELELFGLATPAVTAAV